MGQEGQESGGKEQDRLVSRVPGDAGTNTWQTLEEWTSTRRPVNCCFSSFKTLILFICARVDWDIQVPIVATVCEKLVLLNTDYPLARKGLLGLLDILSDCIEIRYFGCSYLADAFLRTLYEHDVLRLQEDKCYVKQASRVEYESFIYC
jgi:hypothetical protein